MRAAMSGTLNEDRSNGTIWHAEGHKSFCIPLYQQVKRLCRGQPLKLSPLSCILDFSELGYEDGKTRDSASVQICTL